MMKPIWRKQQSPHHPLKQWSGNADSADSPPPIKRQIAALFSRQSGRHRPIRGVRVPAAPMRARELCDLAGNRTTAAASHGSAIVERLRMRLLPVLALLSLVVIAKLTTIGGWKGEHSLLSYATFRRIYLG